MIVDVYIRERIKEHFNCLWSRYVDVIRANFMAPVRFHHSTSMAHREITHDGRQSTGANHLLCCHALPSQCKVWLHCDVVLESDKVLDRFMVPPLKIFPSRPSGVVDEDPFSALLPPPSFFLSFAFMIKVLRIF